MCLQGKSCCQINRPGTEDKDQFLNHDADIVLTKEEYIKGYKVRVNYQLASQDEIERKREAVARVILDAFKRLKQIDQN